MKNGHYSDEKERIYIKKKVNVQNSKDPKEINTTLDLVADDIPITRNFGYCMTTANEYSIINDIITDNILGSNFINDTLEFDTTELPQKKKLNQKIIEIVKNTIHSRVTSARLFPYYHFRKGCRIVYYDQLKKKNDFQREFYPLYSGHILIQMLSKDPLWFKIMNPHKIAQLMELYNPLKNPGAFNKQVAYTKEINLKSKSPGKTRMGKSSKADMNPTITLELLTKIPIRHSDKIKNNKRLEIQYSKAKEATVGIRRLEYAYNMKTGFIYNKNIFKQKIKRIQRWWRSILRSYSEFYIISKIQSIYRGHMERVGMYDTCRIIDEVLPALYIVDNMIVRKKMEYFFNILYRKFAYLSISHKLADQIDLIKRNIKAYIMRKRQLAQFSKPYITKCSMIKFVCEISTKRKIDKLQSAFRFHLMHNSDKIMYAYGYNIHPYLYYKLKYKRKTPLIYRRKIIKFNGYIKKLKLLNLKANKGITNKFEYLRVILLRKPFNDLRLYDKEYVYRRKHGILGKYLNDLIKETKLQKKYLKRWNKNAMSLMEQEQWTRLNTIIKTISVPHNVINLKKYFNRWRTKIGLVYQIVSLFHKKKDSDKNLFIYKKKTKCLKDLFDDYNLSREGQKEKELLNAIKRWKEKIGKLKERENLINNKICKAEDIRRKFFKTKSLKNLKAKSDANKREEIIKKALLNKNTKERDELSKYFKRWKKDCLHKVLTSVFNKTFLKEKSIQLGKLSKWGNKSMALKARDDNMKRTIELINNHKLLHIHLAKFRKKIRQLGNIEGTLTNLVKKISNKNENCLLKKYYEFWKFKKLMHRIMIREHQKKLLTYLHKWNRCKRSIHLIGTLIQKKYRNETINLRKYFDRWRHYNIVYKKYILPLYQTKAKLFEKILSRPIEKRRHAINSEVLEKLNVKANDNKKDILSNLRNRIMAKHSRDQEEQFMKLRAIKNDIVAKEKLKHRRESSIRHIFNTHTLRCSTSNVKIYFDLWRRKFPHHLYNCLNNFHKKCSQSLIIYFIRWKKQAYKFRLNSASDKLTNRIKRRNYLRKFNLGCNQIYFMRLIQAAELVKKRSNIKKIIFKNIFSAIRSNLNYENQVKGLTKLTPIAIRQFRLYLLKWKIQAKRVILTQKRFYSNVNRRLLTNNKKSLLSNLLAKAGKRREMFKGSFFKVYKKAAGVHYIKCYHQNLQVFFFYRQKKYLSKRKYRMLKYVINKMNCKLIKHQSLKRFVKDWRRITRFCLMIDCLLKRIEYLDKGKVSLRFGIRKWYHTS